MHIEIIYFNNSYFLTRRKKIVCRQKMVISRRDGFKALQPNSHIEASLMQVKHADEILLRPCDMYSKVKWDIFCHCHRKNRLEVKNILLITKKYEKYEFYFGIRCRIFEKQ